jgi:hypothetical protein
MNSTVTGLLLMAIGVLAMLGSALNWGIVSRSGKLLNMLVGDTIARVIYFVLGIVLFVLGLNQLTGANWF